jgi:hypothetical protein
MPKALLVAFRCKNDQHVAHGDDGFSKQDDADPEWDTPRGQRPGRTAGRPGLTAGRDCGPRG